MDQFVGGELSFKDWHAESLNTGMYEKVDEERLGRGTVRGHTNRHPDPLPGQTESWAAMRRDPPAPVGSDRDHGWP